MSSSKPDVDKQRLLYLLSFSADLLGSIPIPALQRNGLSYHQYIDPIDFRSQRDVTTRLWRLLDHRHMSSGMETCCHLAAFVSYSVCGFPIRALTCFDKREFNQLQPVIPADTSNLCLDLFRIKVMMSFGHIVGCCETGGNC